MKAEQISERIWALKVWFPMPIRVWVVVEADGVTLVDAGLPFMAKGILRFIEELGAGPLQRIVLTHGHGDHVGAIRKIRERHNVPVYAHHAEFPYMEGELPYPRRKKAQVSVQKGLAQPLPVATDGTLEAIGSLTPYFTPGHAPGHVAYYQAQDGVLLAGDLFTSKKGRLHRPMPIFTGDMAEALRSSIIVKQLRPKRLEICHSPPVFDPGDQWEAYMRANGQPV